MKLKDLILFYLPPRQYSQLKVNLILDTLQKLQNRIEERFPNSGLSKVCAELNQVGIEIKDLCNHLRNPIWILRILNIIAIGLIVTMMIGAISISMELSPGIDGLAELIQVAEAAMNELILLAIAIFFFFSLETRFKRRLALKSLHRLRSITHVVDMHQLTKDPAHILNETPSTSSSPQRAMTDRELTRYFDHCNDMLAIISKLAALHAQYMEDSVVLNAVTEVENLTQGLSAKIWQKIMILDVVAGENEKIYPALRAGGNEKI